MASRIHHGAPGSFKSFCLVQRFAIEALKAGRVVVTNIRGFHSLDRVKSQFPDVDFPESAQILALDTDIKQHRLWMGGWFHWVPFGALVIIDEGQRVYPVRRDFKMESLDKFVTPDGYTPEQMPISRPEDVHTAFDMQRHYGWDIYISTPNIAKINKLIREVADYAYFHKSLSGRIPFLFKNQWYEFEHDPEKSGKTLSDRIGKPRRYKADTRIFDCYDSTATGKHSDSKPQSILGDSGLKFKFCVVILALLLSGYFAIKFIDSRKALDLTAKTPVSSSVKSNARPVNLPLQAVIPPPVPVIADNVPDSQARFFDRLSYKILMVASNTKGDREGRHFSFLALTKAGSLMVVRFEELAQRHVIINSRGLCSVELISTLDGSVLPVSCSSDEVVGCSVRVLSVDVVINKGCYTITSMERNEEQVRRHDEQATSAAELVQF